MKNKTLESPVARAAAIEADDLLFQILICLPLYSITCLKSVCKEWHSLIRDPGFRKSWLNFRNRGLKPSTGLLVSCLDPRDNCSSLVEFIPFSSNNKTIPSLRGHEIVESSNGLLLLRSTGYAYNAPYHVSNPTTSTFSTIPKLVANGIIRCTSLAFDPSKTSYHVVSCTSVHSQPDDNSTCIHVTRPIHVFGRQSKGPLKVYSSYLSAGVYWSGSIHWINESLYFNIKNQTLKKMPAPSHYSFGDNYDIGESCDRLIYSRLIKSASSCIIIDVFELKRGYSEWFLKYRVDLDYKYQSTILLSVVHGEEGGLFLVLKTGNKIVRYSLVSKIYDVLHVLPPRRLYTPVFQYIESPFCV